jgi:hypothetical protein
MDGHGMAYGLSNSIQSLACSRMNAEDCFDLTLSTSAFVIVRTSCAWLYPSLKRFISYYQEAAVRRKPISPIRSALSVKLGSAQETDYYSTPEPDVMYEPILSARILVKQPRGLHWPCPAAQLI